MAAFKLNLFIEQGANFEKSGVWTAGTPLVPVDLTSYRARMQVRPDVESSTILLELTTENGRITLGADGSVVIRLNAAETAAIDWDIGVYDLSLIDAADPTDAIRFMRGRVYVSPGVTR